MELPYFLWIFSNTMYGTEKKSLSDVAKLLIHSTESNSNWYDNCANIYWFIMEVSNWDDKTHSWKEV